jgi:hypothetical protein
MVLVCPCGRTFQDDLSMARHRDHCKTGLEHTHEMLQNHRRALKRKKVEVEDLPSEVSDGRLSVIVFYDPRW